MRTLRIVTCSPSFAIAFALIGYSGSTGSRRVRFGWAAGRLGLRKEPTMFLFDSRVVRKGLTNVGDRLFGTTSYGGGRGNSGTTLALTVAGAESVLHRFTEADGRDPKATMTKVNGTLYGTTVRGGTRGGYGTIFTITTSGAETVLYNFKGRADGAYPRASLIRVGDRLYGTTAYGGGTGCAGNGCGTVFSLPFSP
jgi:uncharacterized repeat protein (TIGR03803 family)